MKFKVSHIFGLHKNLRLLTLLGTRQATKRGCWVGPHFPFWPQLSTATTAFWPFSKLSKNSSFMLV